MDLTTLKRLIPKTVKEVLRPGYNELVRLATGITPGSLKPDVVAKLINKPNPIIFEIGCNDGTDTLELLKEIPDAKIYCFEPDARAVKRFRSRIKETLDAVILVEIALSDRDGWIDFHHSDGDLGGLVDGWDLSGSIRPPKRHLEKHPEVKFERVTRIKTDTLDNVCDLLGVKHIDFVWMDVQGAEGDVLKGGVNILKNISYLYTEYSNNELYEGQLSLKKLRELLLEFELVTRFPNDVLFKNRRLGIAAKPNNPTLGTVARSDV